MYFRKLLGDLNLIPIRPLTERVNKKVVKMSKPIEVCH